MLRQIIRKMFGTANDRFIQSLQKYVVAINALEEQMAALSDEALQAYTPQFKAQLAAGKTLDDLLPEAFAVVRETSKRVLGLRHFDVQLLGGIVLHKGMIAEMRTGEGKTLVATLPTYLNALTEKGVHVVTVNDYLAQRDAEWMGKIYRFLGMSVGCVTPDRNEYDRKEAYDCDITYITNNDLGFDYLRDNMKYSLDQLVQRPFHFAIIDEVDSILIDEARTPLIISGPTEDNSDLYQKINELTLKLVPADYEKDEKARSVNLTEEGITHMEALLHEAGLLAPHTTLYDLDQISLSHHVNLALRAHTLFTRDVDYMVRGNAVHIIDEFTGRIMEGRRYSEGLHQALEAKEGVKIQNENQTLASITYQNLFRLYPRLAGMTGTAMTEAQEFQDIYKLNVVEIPTHLPIRRIDEQDEIYGTAKEKYTAIINEVIERHRAGQPILVGTISIENSEYLSSLLKKQKIPHQVLNARYHEQEAEIIAQAGRSNAVTIATNMAGRGTDIMLGGNPERLIAIALKDEPNPDLHEPIRQKIYIDVATDKEKVLALGGLLVLCSERHESRRIDNQLRGRSGRQGDPGRTKFFLSLEDDLLRIFGSNRLAPLLIKMGLQEGEAIVHPMVSKALERAQQRVEARNYEMRKTLLRFDDVMNEQRKMIYEQRLHIMRGEDTIALAEHMAKETVAALCERYFPRNSFSEEWDILSFNAEMEQRFHCHPPIESWLEEEGVDENEITSHLQEYFLHLFNEKKVTFGEAQFSAICKRILLLTLDHQWKDHLHHLDHLRQGINLRAYGQKDPLIEYKREAFHMFEAMLTQLQFLVTSRISNIELIAPEETSMPAPPAASVPNPSLPPFTNEVSSLKAKRNDPCPCGSGKKFKHCHGSL